jgi:hypothetical protein
LIGAAWYHRVDGPVYSVGGAVAEFVLRRYDPGRFLRLDFACRPGRFEEACPAGQGVDLDALEPAFWAEVEGLAGHQETGRDRSAGPRERPPRAGAAGR